MSSNMRYLCQRQFPDYYDMIKMPMSLEIVKQKLDEAAYDNLKAVVTDIGQIFNNAKRCRSPYFRCTLNLDNIKESAIFQHAKRLHVR